MGDNGVTILPEDGDFLVSRPGETERQPAYIADTVYYTRTDPQCLSCLWFKGAGKCDAFPDNIPDRIYLNLADHRKPYPGDGGIQYKQRT